MPVEKCQAKTKQGKPCRNKAVSGGFCRTHSNVTTSTKAKTTSTTKSKTAQAKTTKPKTAKAKTAKSTTVSQEQVATTATSDAIVNTGAKLVESLEKTIHHMPDLMDRLFKYSGAQFMAPRLSGKIQKRATDQALEKLRKWQDDFVSLGADPDKLDQLLVNTRKLEAMVESILLTCGRYIPESMRNELKQSLARLQSLKGS